MRISCIRIRITMGYHTIMSVLQYAGPTGTVADIITTTGVTGITGVDTADGTARVCM